MQSYPMDTSWIVVRTKPRQERVAKFFIERQGVETYYPRFVDRDGKVQSLFPSYLFVLMQNGQFYFLKSTYGVLRPIMLNGDAPSTMDGKIIERYRQEEVDGLIKPYVSRFKNGQKVRIIGGPFINEIATFCGMDHHQRNRVLLEMLGMQVNTTIPKGYLQAV